MKNWVGDGRKRCNIGAGSVKMCRCSNAPTGSFLDQFRASPYAPTAGAQQTAVEAIFSEFALGCQAAHDADFLATLDSTTTAKDIERIRIRGRIVCNTHARATALTGRHVLLTADISTV